MNLIAMRSQRARVILTACKLLIAPAVFALVARQAFKSAPEFPVKLEILHLAAAVAIYQIAIFFTSARLSALASSFGARLSLKSAFYINIVSHLYYFVFATSIAMEGVRLYMLRQCRTGLGTGQLLAIILLDRMVGAVASLGLFLAATAPMARRLPAIDHIEFYAGLSAAAVILAAMLIALIPAVRVRVLAMLALMIEAKANFALALVEGLLANLILAAGTWSIARSLAMHMTFGQILWAATAGQVLMLIPFSLMGMGAAEFGGVALLAAVGVSLPEAVAVVFLIYLMRASAALIGLGVEVFKDGATLLARRPNSLHHDDPPRFSRLTPRDLG